MRKEYNFWPGEQGLDAWDVDHLIALSKDFPVKTVDLEMLSEIDVNYWSLGENTTIRDIAGHVELVLAADVSYPIILASSGRIMDGMHRVVKVLISGGGAITAVQFEIDPLPNFKNCQPDELPY